MNHDRATTAAADGETCTVRRERAYQIVLLQVQFFSKVESCQFGPTPSHWITGGHNHLLAVVCLLRNHAKGRGKLGARHRAWAHRLKYQFRFSSCSRNSHDLVWN